MPTKSTKAKKAPPTLRDVSEVMAEALASDEFSREDRRVLTSLHDAIDAMVAMQRGNLSGAFGLESAVSELRVRAVEARLAMARRLR